MTREESKQHIQQIRRQRFWLDEATRQPNQNPLLGMLRRALNQLATGIFEHAHHYVFELTQNADDNSYPADAEHFLKFVLLENDPTGTPGSQGCLCVLNDETGFERAHVESLCDIGTTTKHNRQGYIGEKGIGFKSVFLISDRPHIISNGYSFHFRRDDCDAGLGYIVPHWIDQVPTVAEGSSTAILLPLRSAPGVDVAKQLADIEPECILFLRRLRRIELVSAGTGLNRTVRCSGAQGFVNLDADATRASYFVHRAEHSCAHIQEPLREGVGSTQVTVALPLTTSEATDGRVFAFLPTEARTGFPFLINADFLVPASRERIFDTPEWNRHLVKCAAPTFVEAFDTLRGTAEYRTTAYRFIPTKGDLLPGASLFAPLVEAVQMALKEEECILTESGDAALPRNAYFAGPLSRRLLADAPPKLANFRLVHPALEDYRKRIEPLGIQTLTINQVLDICGDADWLREREVEWWETMFDLLSRNDIKAEVVAPFPMLRCRDGICRRPADGVFFHVEGQPTPTSLLPGWPAAHLLDADLQSRLQPKPAVWAWLIRVAGLRAFSIRSYIIGPLLDWMRGQPGLELIQATRFIAANLKHFDTQSQLTPAQRRLGGTQAQQMLREKMPWLLADGQVLLPEARTGKELVTPECLEGDAGWNLLFPAIDRHFFVIHDAYCAGVSEGSLAELLKVFKACGATAFPDPRLRELSAGDSNYDEALARCAHAVHGTPKLRDWTAPGWLLGLHSVEQTTSGQRKIEALERWLKTLGGADATKLLHCSRPDYLGGWEQISAWSEFGTALRTKAWLLTSKGYTAPPTALLDTPEFREFFGDSVPYVATDIAAPFLEKLGARVHLTAEVLIGRLREMSGSKNPDLALLAKIYRRLQDSTFDAGAFKREKLIFLSEPKPCWASTHTLVWEDAGALFDDDFGYVRLTYGTSDLHRFFTETLRIPAQPELKHYAVAWKRLCSGAPADRALAEKKLKIILQHLAESQAEVANCDWWRELKPHLHIWTDAGCFEPPAQVYVPDDFMAVQLFTGRIRVAFPPKPNAAVLGFLRWIGCRSLTDSIQRRLVGTGGECARPCAAYLTRAAKELCVLLVCSQHGWQERCSRLEALLETEEFGVTTLTLEFALRDNPGAGTQLRTPDAHWDAVNRRLLLRDGVEPESLRDAVAKSMAVAFFGEAESAEMQAEFFLVLTVSVERARKLMHGRSKWRLTPEQQDWLRQRRWQVVIAELDKPEPPQCPRTPSAPTSPPVDTTTATPAVVATSQAGSAVAETADTQHVGSTHTETASLAPELGKQGPLPSDTAGTSHEQAAGAKPATETPDDLHDATSTTADFVPVRAHTRSRPERPRREQAQGSSREATSGMTTASAQSKAALEQCGRDFAARKLQGMGYTVTHMAQHSPGYDLLAEKPGDTLKVEVKAHAGEASRVFVTQREWQEHLRTRSVSGQTWELWNVENLSKASGKKPTIQRVRHIPKSALKESGYWIDLDQCLPEPRA